MAEGYPNQVLRQPGDQGCLLEDIFINEADRQPPGDAPNCFNLVIAGLDFDAVYREIEAQYRKTGEAKEKIWINYIEEGSPGCRITI